MYQLMNNFPIEKPKLGNKFNLAKLTAKQNNEKLYFTGKPCKRGHISNRFVANNMCVECNDFHHSDKEYRRNKELIKKYGITKKQYNEMRDKQNGVCLICKQKETKKVHRKICDLSVDHCHDTKKIRGLLCYACNVGIGFFRHNPLFLKEAALYCEVK